MKLGIQANEESGKAMVPPQSFESANSLNTNLLAHFRHISATVQSNKTNTSQQIYGFTSSVRGEGVTTIALGVAQCLATEMQANVLLVECDLRKPTLYDRLQIPQEPGLSDLLGGRAGIDPVVRKTSLARLSVIPAGTAIEGSFPLARIPWFSSLLDSAKSQVDFVILDLPPVVSDPIGPLMTNLAESTYLVVRAGSVPADTVKEALSKLDQSRLKGTILNDTKNYLPRWLNRLF